MAKEICVVKFLGGQEPARGTLTAYSADDYGNITYAKITGESGSEHIGCVERVETEQMGGA